MAHDGCVRARVAHKIKWSGAQPRAQWIGATGSVYAAVSLPCDELLTL